MSNDIQSNIRNDQDKDQSVTVYLTRAEKAALEYYCDSRHIAMSDWVGSLIWPRLKQAGLLPEEYRRPRGF